nr:glycoside hydrolase family 13 protein [Aestuariibacter salexigens]
MTRLLVVAFLLLVQGVTYAQSLERVEPSFWWADMVHPDLQLMVHGDNIAGAQVRLDYPGVQIERVESLDNPNYAFIYLSLSDTLRPGIASLEFVLPSGESVSRPYEFKRRRAGSAQRQGFDASDVIYLITPDRFANGDPANDQVEGLREGPERAYKGGRHGGDIQGIIAHLDYIEDMGFTQIWTMPLLVNDMPQYSYHGYSTTDYYNIDPRLGSNALYAELSAQARQRGIGVIMDVILNHIGSEHWWMKDLPSADWINNGGEFTPTSHRREALHDPHGAMIDKQAFNDGWFVETMPDLNQRNPHLATYLIQNAIWWIEFADLSGIRVDTYSYSDKAFLGEWTRRVMQEYPNFNIVGEEWSVNPAIVAYWQQDSRRHDDYQSYLPSVMDFPLQTTLISALQEPETWATGLRKLYELIASDFLYGDPYNLVVFGDNHDMSRVFTQLNEDPELLKMAMSFIMTMRGIPQVFYGTEIAMSNAGTDDHGIIRSDFPGGWSDDLVNAFTGKGLSPLQQDMQLFFKRLLNWRQTSDAIARGKLTQYAPDNGTYVFFRTSERQQVMVVLNKNDQPASLDLQRFSEVLRGPVNAADAITGRPYRLEDTLTVGPKQTLILQIQQ